MVVAGHRQPDRRRVDLRFTLRWGGRARRAKSVDFVPPIPATKGYQICVHTVHSVHNAAFPRAAICGIKGHDA